MFCVATAAPAKPSKVIAERMITRAEEQKFTNTLLCAIPCSEKMPIKVMRLMANTLWVTQGASGTIMRTHKTRIVAIEKKLNKRIDAIVA